MGGWVDGDGGRREEEQQGRMTLSRGQVPKVPYNPIIHCSHSATMHDDGANGEKRRTSRGVVAGVSIAAVERVWPKDWQTGGGERAINLRMGRSLEAEEAQMGRRLLLPPVARIEQQRGFQWDVGGGRGNTQLWHRREVSLFPSSQGSLRGPYLGNNNN